MYYFLSKNNFRPSYSSVYDHYLTRHKALTTLNDPIFYIQWKYRFLSSYFRHVQCEVFLPNIKIWVYFIIPRILSNFIQFSWCFQIYNGKKEIFKTILKRCVYVMCRNTLSVSSPKLTRYIPDSVHSYRCSIQNGSFTCTKFIYRLSNRCSGQDKWDYLIIPFTEIRLSNSDPYCRRLNP